MIVDVVRQKGLGSCELSRFLNKSVQDWLDRVCLGDDLGW